LLSVINTAILSLSCTGCEI